MDIRPIGDMVLVERVELEMKKGTILLPHGAKDVKNTGKIIAAGEGKFTDNGVLLPMRVKVGDSIIFNHRAGTDVKFGNKEFTLMSESAIFAVLKND